MAHMQSKPNIFHIPPGIPFLPALVRAVNSGTIFENLNQNDDPLQLTGWTILLPTRRAARSLIEAFLADNKSTTRLLPSIRTLGDSDEAAALFAPENDFHDHMELPPAVSPLSRQFILARLIRQWANENPATILSETIRSASGQVFDLARSLAGLVDRLDTHEAVLADMAELFAGDFPGHQQIAHDFLKIISEQLPRELQQRGMIGPMERRSRLMQNYARQLLQNGSQGPVIAAGSTGSIPATAQLLSVIANLENGAVILPGLDTQMDDAGWDKMKEHHPQFGMRELLVAMKAKRSQVRPLGNDAENTDRIWLAGEVMRPAETTQEWRASICKTPGRVAKAISGVTLINAAEQSEEASIIALIMRKAIHDKRKASLITPDRRLAQKVKAAMARWHIEIDDSAGEPLSNSSEGIFFRLVLDTPARKFSPPAIKALLSHPFTAITDDSIVLETGLLRSGRSWNTLDEFIKIAENEQQRQAEQKYLHPTVRRLTDDDWQALRQQAELIADAFKQLEQCYESGDDYPLQQLIEYHLAACEKLTGSPVLWQGDAGEQLSNLMQSMLDAHVDCPELSITDYNRLLQSMLAQSPVRPRFSEHPDLSIFGLMEARLIASDIIILGGLNENVWPMAASADPWLNRPQSVDIGIPVPERRIGLSAHDFVQGFCNQQTYITSSGKIDGTPAVASRWLTRLAALLKAANVEAKPDHPWIEWSQKLDRSATTTPIDRPAPVPAKRPTRFSVTAIDKLLKNPYEFYADRILKLKALNELTSTQGPAERGSMVHLALERFCTAWPKELPADAKDQLKIQLHLAVDEFFDDKALAAFYAAQLDAMADWFIDNEHELRHELVKIHTETEADASFTAAGQTCILTARADRIDELHGRGIRIIDYKTGELPSFRENTDKYSAQLLLEGWLASVGGFSGLPDESPSEIAYIKLSGAAEPGKMTSLDSKLDEAIISAVEGMTQLVSHYLEPGTAYQANARPERVDSEREYDHLSRWREWAYFHLQEDGND